MPRIDYREPVAGGEIPPETAGLALYRLLANAPAMVPAWHQWAGALRNRPTSSRLLRELVILRTAQLTGARYEWAHHHQIAEGLGLPAEKGPRTVAMAPQHDL